MNEPRNHHYAPQFFLRNFAIDEEKKIITTVAKHGDMAIWSERSIQTLGYERDFYVHMKGGIPKSVETDINRNIEIPISQSDTWQKISSGKTEELDQSDRAILYAMARHFEARTPHYQATLNGLIAHANDPASTMIFSDEEREMYRELKNDPDSAKERLNGMATSMAWTARAFEGAIIMVLRSPIPLRTSTTPAIAIPIPHHPNLALSLPGMLPYKLALTLNKNTMVSIILGDFDGTFCNQEIDINTAKGFNQHFLAHFAKFNSVRHLVTDKQNLVQDMEWAPYKMTNETEKKVVFKRVI